MRHLKRTLTSERTPPLGEGHEGLSFFTDVDMLPAPELPLLRAPSPARPLKARRSPRVKRVTWSDIAQHSQESLQSPSSPRTPAFRIRTPTSPPALQKREDPESEMKDGRLEKEFCQVEQIGRGQFSTVYKAKNCVDQCLYAVKKTTRISKGLRQSELREVFALANVSREAAACQYIVRYFASWFEDGRLHIQTELCQCSLRDRLNEKKAWLTPSFEENELLEVLRHVAAGLQVLHSLQIVHLDIKPDNILVGRNQECYKIADLGLAAAAMGTGCDEITEGDCRYLAKEVLRGDLRDLPKADVFSLGLVLYELATNPKGLPSNGPEWHSLREQLEVQNLTQLSGSMQTLLREMAHSNKECRPSSKALLEKVGASSPELKALEEENRRCRAEALRNKQLADEYWQEMLQMKKQELLSVGAPVEEPPKVQLRRSHTTPKY